MGELDGKVAIITGAGRLRSIGRGAAIALAEMGCSIVAVGTGGTPRRFLLTKRRSAGGTSRASPTR